MAFDSAGLDSYNDVATRLAEFRTKHPEGSLQPVNPAEPFKVMDLGGQTFIVYTAAAYRTPDDPRPGIGSAYEQFPGRTPYTRGSELQNAETSAWGRAVVAALAADTRKGVASLEEVRNRQAERDQPMAPEPVTDPAWLEAIEAKITACGTGQELKTVGGEIASQVNAGRVSQVHREHLGYLYQQRQNELRDAVTQEQAGEAA